MRHRPLGFAVALSMVVIGAASVEAAAPLTAHPASGSFDLPTDAGVLYSQLDDPSGSAFLDQAFETSYAAYSNLGADDFVVVSAQGWDITTVHTPGVLVPTSGHVPAFVNVAFHTDSGGLPGSIVSGCDFPASTDFATDGSGDLSIRVACNLPPGVFWYSQQVRIDFSLPPFVQHLWATRNTAEGNLAAWRNPFNGFGFGCENWTPAVDCGSQAGPDNLFELLGSEREDGDGPAVPAQGTWGTGLLAICLVAGATLVLLRRH